MLQVVVKREEFLKLRERTQIPVKKVYQLDANNFIMI